MRSIWRGSKQWLRELAREKPDAYFLAAFGNARLLTIFKTNLLRIATHLTQKISKHTRRTRDIKHKRLNANEITNIPSRRTRKKQNGQGQAG